MPRQKRALVHPPANEPVQSFATAEEAWFWYARIQMLRNQGARFDRHAGAIGRPCDPDDIYRAVMQLRRSGRLSPRHLAILARFGAALTPPDPRARDGRVETRLWDEALDALGTVLKGKGIVESVVNTRDIL